MHAILHCDFQKTKKTFYRKKGTEGQIARMALYCVCRFWAKRSRGWPESGSRMAMTTSEWNFSSLRWWLQNFGRERNIYRLSVVSLTAAHWQGCSFPCLWVLLAALVRAVSRCCCQYVRNCVCWVLNVFTVVQYE
jgi:hypothetical protein